MTVTPLTRSTVRRWTERLLLGAGGLCLGLALLGWAEAAVFQWALEWRLDRALAEGAGSPAPSSSLAAVQEAQAGEAASGRGAAPEEATAERTGARVAVPVAGEEPIGRLTAPRLGLSAVVAEGVSSHTLRRAVGHIPGTALPWEDGNVGLAAHRDSFFHRLKDVQVGDTLKLVTPRGRFEYVVRSLDIVTPERADVLEEGGSPRLTLVTCYPFSMVGPAPNRFIVTAERVDSAPARAAALWTPLSRTGR
jgi:sortase A